MLRVDKFLPHLGRNSGSTHVELVTKDRKSVQDRQSFDCSTSMSEGEPSQLLELQGRNPQSIVLLVPRGLNTPHSPMLQDGDIWKWGPTSYGDCGRRYSPFSSTSQRKFGLEDSTSGRHHLINVKLSTTLDEVARKSSVHCSGRIRCGYIISLLYPLLRSYPARMCSPTSLLLAIL